MQVKKMFNPSKLMKLKNSWDTFTRNHPKFPSFINAVQQNGLEEGTIIEINVKTADGKSLSSNIKLTQSDIEMIRDLSEFSKNQ